MWWCGDVVMWCLVSPLGVNVTAICHLPYAAQLDHRAPSADAALKWRCESKINTLLIPPSSTSIITGDDAGFIRTWDMRSGGVHCTHPCTWLSWAGTLMSEVMCGELRMPVCALAYTACLLMYR